MAKTGRKRKHNSILGNKLDKLKSFCNIADLSKFFGVSEATVGRFSNGSSKPDASELQNLVLNYAASNDMRRIDLNWLLDDSDWRDGPVFIRRGGEMGKDEEKPEERSKHHLIIAVNLRKIRAKFGNDQIFQLVRDAEVDFNDWLKWEADIKSPPSKKLEKIAIFAGIDPANIDKPLPEDEWPMPVPDSIVNAPAPGDIEALKQARQTSKSGPKMLFFPTPLDDIPESNAIRRKGDQDAAHRVLHLKAVGDGTGLPKGSSLRGIFNDNGSFWDEEEIPETTHLVRIRGDSMSPMIMHGQYAMVGPQYMVDRSDVPGHRDIVIAEVTVQDNDIGGVDSNWEGVHCKRIQEWTKDVWLFTSINPAGETFTVAKNNCRLWRVIGVYFAGKGKPPEED
jgi:transcriptional regulator with XRE-family HTH domain